MKVHLTDTIIAKHIDLNNIKKESLSFLVDNASSISIPKDIEDKMLNNVTESLSANLIVELFSQAVAERKTSIIKPLIYGNALTQIPSQLLISWLDIDTSILNETNPSAASILNSLSNYRNKSIFDISTYLTGTTYTIRDYIQFYARVVKILLCRSYNEMNQMWLTPNIILSLTEIYARVIGYMISSRYALSQPEQSVIMAILALYFTSRCHESDELFQPFLLKLPFCNMNANLLKELNDKYTCDQFSISTVLSEISQNSSSRLSDFNYSTLNLLVRTINTNQMISNMSIEYPPYFVYIVLASISGDKSRMYNLMKSIRVDKTISNLKIDIARTTTFIKGLK